MVSSKQYVDPDLNLHTLSVQDRRRLQRLADGRHGAAQTTPTRPVFSPEPACIHARGAVELTGQGRTAWPRVLGDAPRRRGASGRQDALRSTTRCEEPVEEVMLVVAGLGLAVDSCRLCSPHSSTSPVPDGNRLYRRSWSNHVHRCDLDAAIHDLLDIERQWAQPYGTSSMHCI
ncbi:uncharacterized protein [Lolium perenne]|uniref:uncharacterized protein n=1 Tax=Lolium perenne TaxID=4522 RepID=UPI0021F5F81E|nr:uncharacterized protein LOC127307861 [Lolium perenne]